MLDTLEPKQVQINFQVPPDLKAQMQRQAHRLNMTLSEYLRHTHQCYMETCSTEAVEAKAMLAYEKQ